MKKTLLAALLCAALLTLLGQGCATGIVDGPADPVRQCVEYIYYALKACPDCDERAFAYPEVLEEIQGRLSANAPAARALGEAARTLREDGKGAASRALDMLEEAVYSLRDRDVAAPFFASELDSMRRHHLLELDDIDAFSEAFVAKGEAGMQRFALVCSDSLWQFLQQPAVYSPGVTLLGDLLDGLGAREYAWHLYDDIGLMVFDPVTWYPGQRILWAWRQGRADALDDEERRTLDAALAIAESATGSDLERERIIHDALCDRIAYLAGTNGGNGRCDGAVGALLDGLADCDGYSDAFVLCCGLTGLEARFIHGDAVNRPQSDAEGLHMWNLIRIDGCWLSVDVTWDDGEARVNHCDFNLGEARMALGHIWDARTLRVPLEPGSEAAFRDDALALYEINAWDELPALMRGVAGERPSCVRVLYPLALIGSETEQTVADAVYGAGVQSLGWTFQNGILELYDLRYPDAFCFCQNEAEVSAYIERCAAEGTRAFSIYFAPELAQTLFADGHAALARLVSASSLAGMAYSYNEAHGYVAFDDAEYSASRNLAGSLDEALGLMASQLAERRDAFHIVLPDGTRFEDVADALANCLYAHGVTSFAWSATGQRVTFSEITYASEFALARDEWEVLAYLGDCMARGASSCRIYCDPALYDRLSADGFSAFFDLLREAGCRCDGISYNGEYGMIALDPLVF